MKRTRFRSGVYRVLICFFAPLFCAQAIPPTFSLQPSNQYSPLGVTAQFTAKASGSPPLNYQWQFYGSNIPGASGTASSGLPFILSITNAQFSNAGPYHVIVTNTSGSLSSTDALLVVGMVAAWGNSTTLTNIPVTTTNIASLAAGGAQWLAVNSNGTVIAWGQDFSGNTHVPGGLGNVIEASTAGNSMALRNDGTVVCWGDNTFGQTNVPADVTNVAAISTGGYDCMALLVDGSVRVWGNNQNRQTNVPSGLKGIAIACGNSVCLAVTRRGAVSAWGTSSSGQLNVPANLTDVVAVAVGSSFCMALKSDGTVTVWGQPSDPALSVPPSATNIVAIAAGGSACLALRNDGMIIGWGSGPQVNMPAGFTNIVSIGAGSGTLGSYTLARRNFGEPAFTATPANETIWAGQSIFLPGMAIGAQPLAYQWQCNGTNIPGGTGASFNLPNAQPGSSGSYTLIVSNAMGVITSAVANVTVKQQLTIAAWGSPANSDIVPPSSYSNIIAIASSGSHSLILSDDGWVKGWGYSVGANDGFEALKPPNLTNAIVIATGDLYNMALLANGNTVSWGFSEDFNFTNNNVSGFNGFVAVAGGAYHKLGLTRQGTVQALADHGSTAPFFPSGYETPPAGLSGVKAIAAGYGHSLALKNDGTVVSWGVNYSGETNVPPGLSNVMAIACGDYHQVALMSNGTVVAWGDNSLDQTSVPAGLSNVVAIAAHHYHTLALKSDGTIVGWGYNQHGECIPPDGLTNIFSIAAGGNSFALVGDSPPVISMMPPGLTVALNNTGQLQTVVSGSRPLTYQWFHEGTNIPGGTNLSLSITNIAGTAAGAYCLIASNAWGPTTSRVAQVSTGPIVTWGFLGPFIPYGVTNPTSIAAGFHFTVALDHAGNLSEAGYPFTVAPLPTGVKRVDSGAIFISAIDTNGTFSAWGDSFISPSIPTNLPTIAQSASGQAHFVCLTTTGTVVSWEFRLPNYGQTNVPSGLTNVVAVAAGDYHSMALKGDGTVVCWGTITNAPSGLSNVVAIAAGGGHCFALKSDGSLVTWSSGSDFIGSTPVDVTNVVAIGASYYNAAVINSDGSLRVWGSSSDGETTPPVAQVNVNQLAVGFAQLITLLGDGSPYITVQPFPRFVNAGNPVTLQVMALGNPPLSYQWLFNGTNIDGATNSTLTLNTLHLTDTGMYQCIVSNSLGTATSSVANLTVQHPPLLLSALSTNNAVALHVNGLDESGPVTVYTSPDLTTWTPIWTNPPVFGPWDFVDPSPDPLQRFYRVSQQH